MSSDKPEQYCVYESDVAEAILEVARSSHAAALKAHSLYPGCDIGAMFSTAAHRAATIAHNAAVGKPLDRLSRTDPASETVAPLPELGERVALTPEGERLLAEATALSATGALTNPQKMALAAVGVALDNACTENALRDALQMVRDAFPRAYLTDDAVSASGARTDG